MEIIWQEVGYWDVILLISRHCTAIIRKKINQLQNLSAIIIFTTTSRVLLLPSCSESYFVSLKFISQLFMTLFFLYEMLSSWNVFTNLFWREVVCVMANVKSSFPPYFIILSMWYFFMHFPISTFWSLGYIKFFDSVVKKCFRCCVRYCY